MTLRESIETIAKQAVAADIFFNGVYKYRTGIFDPITQIVQGIALADASVLNGIKLYSMGGMKYLTIPPGTEILVTFVNGDPVVIGIDPSALVIMSAISTGIVPGAITLTPG